MLRKSLLPILMMSAVLCAGRAQAQNVLMNSAETINPGNFKIAAFPTVLFGKNDTEDEFGVAGRFGYGFTDRFDMEGKLAFFDGVQLYGLDAEYWAVKGPVDVSLSLGAHLTSFGDDQNSSAIDTALLVSGNVADKLELYGGVNVSFESIDDLPDDVDGSFTRAYVVPGLEYKIHPDLDLVAEFGIGLNDDSPHYVSAGLAFYIR